MSPLSIAALLAFATLLTACATTGSVRGGAEATLDQDLNGDGLIRGDDIGASRSTGR